MQKWKWIIYYIISIVEDLVPNARWCLREYLKVFLISQTIMLLLKSENYFFLITIQSEF